MTRLSADECGGTNVVAFLDMLAVSEGTDNGRQPTNDDGYDVMVGGKLFTDYRDHPRKVVRLSAKLSSSAAGRYQFLRATWDDLARRLRLPDFSPASQDRACIQLLKECGALPLVRIGAFDEAVAKSRRIWASLPGAGYGQHENTIESLRAAYLRAGGFYRCPIPKENA